MDYSLAIEKAKAFWEGMAEKGGWKLGSLTVWVDGDGDMVDAVGTRQENGKVYVVDYDTEKLLYEEAI